MTAAWQTPSPLGTLVLTGDETALTGLRFLCRDRIGETTPASEEMPELPVFRQTRVWLDRYFRGMDPGFTPPLRLAGTPFQMRVWDLLLRIPWGETVTYGQLAAQLALTLGRPRMSAQAVGGAVGRNPVALIVPCHRVIGADGSLVGYADGLDRKAWLLEHEAGSGERAAGDRT